MNQLKFGKNILIISIMTLLTVFSWIGFEVYRTYTRTTIPKIIKELINPLNPTIDKTIIDDIEKKYQPTSTELDVITVPTPSPVLELETIQPTTQSGSLE